MDFKKLISQLDQLNEADVKHKGTYGTSYQGDDDEDDDKKTAPASTEKRGRGRPKKAGGDAANAAGYSGAKDLQSMMVGNIPKDSKQLKNLPKTKNKLSDEEPKKKKSTTESLKDWIAMIDEQRMLAEAGLAVQPIGKPGQNFLIRDPANPSASAITTSDPAVVDAAKKGTLSMQKPGAAPASGSGSQVSAMQEDEGSGSKEELARRIYDLEMSHHGNYGPGDPKEYALLDQLKAQFAQQFPGENAFRIGSEISDREHARDTATRNADKARNDKYNKGPFKGGNFNPMNWLKEGEKKQSTSSAFGDMTLDDIYEIARDNGFPDPTSMLGSSELKLAKYVIRFCEKYGYEALTGDKLHEVGKKYAGIYDMEHPTFLFAMAVADAWKNGGVKDSLDLDESSMAEGEDEGKPGKNFAKIAKSAGKHYGSKEAGERVAGAVRAKLMKQGKIKEAALPTHDGDAGAGLGAGRSNYALEGSLNELAKNTLASYGKKASLDAIDRMANAVNDGDGEEAKKAGRRYAGVTKAIDRLAKEKDKEDMSEAAPKSWQRAAAITGAGAGALLGGGVGGIMGALFGAQVFGPLGVATAGIGALAGGRFGVAVGSELAPDALNASHDAIIGAYRKVSSLLGGPEETKAFANAHIKAAADKEETFEFDGKTYRTTMDTIKARYLKKKMGQYSMYVNEAMAEGIWDNIKGAAKEFTRDSTQKMVKQAWENTFWPKYVEPAMKRISIDGRSFHDVVLGEPKIVENDRSKRTLFSQYSIDLVFPIDATDWKSDQIYELTGQLRKLESESWNPNTRADGGGFKLINFVTPHLSYKYSGKKQDLVIPVSISSVTINPNLKREQAMSEASGSVYDDSHKKKKMAESKTAKRDNRAEAAGKKVTKDLEYDMKHKGKDDNKAERAGKKVTKDIEYDEKKCPPMSHIKKMCKDGKTVAQICKMHPNCNQAELKKMVADCKKKMVAEGMDQRLEAARAEGRAHGLRGHQHCGNNYDDMEEARCYHDGYKAGLDECYGQMPIQGMVDEMSNEVEDMASYGAYTPELDEMDKTAYMKQQAIKTPGNTFNAFGQTMHDSDVLDEFAFESLDRQLNALLNEDSVSEGMTVSISKGQENSPDSVSINASDAEADSLLAFVKQAGLGIFGGDDHGDMQDAVVTSAPSIASSDAIEVVDDHDGMLSLIRKMAGQGAAQPAHDHSSEDYADEEETCNECGMAYESCGGNHGGEMVDEMESEDQMTYNVAEDNPPDTGAAETEQEVQDTAQANSSAASFDKAQAAPQAASDLATESEDDEEDEEGGYDAEGNQRPGGPYDAAGHYVGEYSGHDDRMKDRDLDEEEDDADEEEDELEESYANGADDTFESDIEFMTNIISGGANKRKSTGQTTIPVVSTQLNRLGNPMKESTDLLTQWKKLSGI